MSTLDVEEAEAFLAKLCVSGSISIELETSKTDQGLGLQRWAWKVDGVLHLPAVKRLAEGKEALGCGFKPVVFNLRHLPSSSTVPVSGGLAGAFVR